MERWGEGAGGREGRREAAARTSDLARSGRAPARGGAGRSPGRVRAWRRAEEGGGVLGVGVISGLEAGKGRGLGVGGVGCVFKRGATETPVGGGGR